MKSYTASINLAEYPATNDGHEWTLHECKHLFPGMIKYPDNEYYQYEGLLHHIACACIGDGEGELTITAHPEASGSFGWFLGFIEQFSNAYDSVGMDALVGAQD